MTDLQRLQLRASEIRARLATLGGIADLSDEQRAEIVSLRNEYGDTETRAQALTVAADAPVEQRTEHADFRALVGAANMGRIFDAAMEHRAADGAERELQVHLGLAPNQVPLAMLARAPVEMRATGVTPAPGNVGSTQSGDNCGCVPASVCYLVGCGHAHGWRRRGHLSGPDHQRRCRNPCRECRARRDGGRVQCGRAIARPDSSEFPLQPRGPGAVRGHGFSAPHEP